MKRARVVYAGAIHSATPAAEGKLRLADGRVVDESAVSWLVPFEPRTIFAVGLNYADHATELAFHKPQEVPLVFIKGHNSIAGHRAQTWRPEEVAFMHYECELAVVIGKPARKVSRADALQYVSGYTVANDYAIRDYLENYYRPNLRVKNRDGATLLGPWLVDAADVPNPQNLGLQTLVNGREVQKGNTRDMVFDVGVLIEYLSSFLTLAPGDVILTGTPKGSVDVRPGDEVVTSVEGVGTLVNYLIGDAAFAAAAGK